MQQSEDWVQYVLDLPMAARPGLRFEYCNGVSHLLSAILQEATGMTAHAFARQHLFGPLGISDVEWPSSPRGINVGWGRSYMRPHDLAKLGQLYGDKGAWRGRQIVSSAWIAESTRRHTPATISDGYGYQTPVVAPGRYIVAAGTDRDNDRLICESGEACGIFPLVDSPAELVVDGDLFSVDFPVAYDFFASNAAAVNLGLPPRAFDGFRLLDP